MAVRASPLADLWPLGKSGSERLDKVHRRQAVRLLRRCACADEDLSHAMFDSKCSWCKDVERLAQPEEVGGNGTEDDSACGN